VLRPYATGLTSAGASRGQPSEGFKLLGADMKTKLAHQCDRLDLSVVDSGFVVD